MGNGAGYPWRYTPPVDYPNRDKPTETEQRLLRDYQNLRLDCAALEELLGSDTIELSEKDRAEIDKAVTLMKVGFKMIKRRLRAHGFEGRLKAPEPVA
jgi:hypothetical protein